MTDNLGNYKTSLARLTEDATDLAADWYLDYRQCDPKDMVVEFANVKGKQYATRYVNWRAICDSLESRALAGILTEIASTLEVLSSVEWEDEPSFDSVRAKIDELGGLGACHRQHMARLSAEAREARRSSPLNDLL